MKKRQATIKDIAKALKISVSTVSRALRDTYDVSQQTRALVLQKAEELRYRPNLNATGLVKRSTRKLGVVIPVITNYYYATVITGMKDVARENGYSLLLYITDDHFQEEREILRSLPTHSLDGLLICLSSNTSDYGELFELQQEDMPMVFFDRVPTEFASSKVVQDDLNGAYEATRHLIKMGYRRIAHITGSANLQLTQKRLEGYRKALDESGMEFNPDWVIHSGFSQDYGQEDTDKLLSLPYPPDALFAVNDRKAVGALLACKKRGIRIGPEFGVIGFTGDPVGELITPTLSTIVEPAYEIGRISCELLIKYLKKKPLQNEEVMLQGTLMARESTQR